MPVDQTKVFAAVKEFYAAVLEGLRNAQGVHAETAVAAAARMGGMFLLRSFGLPIQALPPGSPVLSDAANEHGPALIDLLGGMLHSMGIAIDASRATSQPTDLKPQLSVLETQERLDAPLRRLQTAHRLSDEEAAHACAIATAFFIRDCASVLNVETAFGIAVYGFVEGTKTVPIRVPDEAVAAATPDKAKPWYKLW